MVLVLVMRLYIGMKGRSKQHHCRETRRGAPGVGAGTEAARGGHEGESGGETQVEDKMSCILLQIGRVTAGGRGDVARRGACRDGVTDRKRGLRGGEQGAADQKATPLVCFERGVGRTAMMRGCRCNVGVTRQVLSDTETFAD